VTPGAGITEQETDARTRLREAALEQFGRRGLQATSTRDIIKAAGLRNPSAISYYFGSKARLVDDLIREVNRDQSAIIQQQVALVRDTAAPAPERWCEIAVDAACRLLATERGCLLIRLWADRDDEQPEAVEEFLAGGHPLAGAWRDAVAATFPDLPHDVAIARCVVQLRTLQFLTVRRARGLLGGAVPSPVTETMASRAFLLELSRNILRPPTLLTAEG
jgi:AcrR family transcriptional regulator